MPIELYADGSSSGKSGQPTGWAWLAVDAQTQDVLFCGSKCSNVGTNNTAELFAVIDGLMECVNRGYTGQVTVVSDSMYALGISAGEYMPKKNVDESLLARKMYQLAGASYRWVRGHNGDKWNEEVDRMAGEARQSLLPAKQRKPKPAKEAKKQNKVLKKQYLKEVSNEEK